jgi:hypothetical protein
MFTNFVFQYHTIIQQSRSTLLSLLFAIKPSMDSLIFHVMNSYIQHTKVMHKLTYNFIINKILSFKVIYIICSSHSRLY